MYAVVKSDLNTLRVELLRCYVPIHTTVASLPAPRRSTQPHSNVPLIPLNPLSLRGRKRTRGESDIVHLRPAEIQLKKQAIGAGSVTLILGEICVYIHIYSSVRDSERHGCRCVGAGEHVNLQTAAVESLFRLQLESYNSIMGPFLCPFFMSPIREPKLITHQAHFDGISQYLT